MIVRIGAVLALILATTQLGLAQPRQTHWPRHNRAWQPSSAQAARNNCLRPDYAVVPNEVRTFEIDRPGGFDGPARLLSGDRTPRGTVALLQDSLIQFTAFPVITESGFDTIRYEVCNTAGDCQELSLRIAAGRAGQRTDLGTAIAPGSSVTLGVAVPSGDLFCGSVTNTGSYDAVDRRRIDFVPFPVGDSILYRSSRAPGLDQFEVAVCNVFGTCDTTSVSISLSATTLTLPFCDDFSAVRGTRPNPAVWLEDDVYINDALALNPPSRGVASFDGLDEGGEPYGDGFGAVDQLTSSFIDIASVPTAPYLKFYLQLGGRGQAPERGDVFIVEGRDTNGDWIELLEVQGSNSSQSRDTFSYYSILLDDATLRHAQFQVRFRMLGNLAGGFDTWNLDYVRIEEGSPEANANDIALTMPPGPVLQPYSAVPYSQFSGNAATLLDPEVNIGLFNHFPLANNVSDSRIRVTGQQGDVLLDAPILTASQLNLPPGPSQFVNTVAPAPFGAFVAAANAASASALGRLETAFILTIDDDQSSLVCAQANDTARSFTVIDDYFAYDDGSAESGLLPGGQGEQLAVRYVATVQDTLRGLRLAFPRLGPLDGDRQLINLQVFIGQLDDTPEYEEILVRPYYPSSVGDTLNALTTYGLVDGLGQPTSLIIPPGEFYVGWQLASDVAEPVPVGLDLAYDNADQIYTEYGFGWEQINIALPNLRGSLMIHPVFSDEILQNSSPTQALVANSVQVYPNPTRGAIELSFDELAGGRVSYTLLDLLGRPVQAGQGERHLHLDVPAGTYALVMHTEMGELRKRIVVVD